MADYVWFSRPEDSRLRSAIEAFFRSVEAHAQALSPAEIGAYRAGHSGHWRRQATAAAKVAIHAVLRNTPKRDKNRQRLRVCRYVRQRAHHFAAVARMGSGPLSLAMDRQGSDKGPRCHHYTPLYEILFSEPERYARILEVGIGSNDADMPFNMGPDGVPGASLRAWRQYFTNAEIVGADLDARVLFEEDRIRTLRVDQTDPDSVDRLFALVGDGFDLIVDDGCHTLRANRTLFECAFARLKPGGTFVIEDVALNARDGYRAFLHEHDAVIVEVPVVWNASDNCLVIVARH